MDSLNNLAEKIHEVIEEKKQVSIIIKSKEMQDSQIKSYISPQIGSQKNRLNR